MTAARDGGHGRRGPRPATFSRVLWKGRAMVIRDRRGTPRIEVVWRNLIWVCAMLASAAGLAAFMLGP